jgi:hypothetical protein
MADGSLAVESKKSPSAAPVAQTSAAIDNRGFHGAALPWFVIRDVLERMDQASQVARRIDARQRKPDHGKDCRSPVLRLAGLIKGIYSTLDREYCNAQCVHDVRCPIPKPPAAVSGASAMIEGEPDLSGNSFALRVRGDSMVDPGGKSYPDGCLIVVDPTREAKSGDRIVVRLATAEEAVFKQYEFDGAQYLLKPLNPRYPIIPMPADAKIVGVVVMSQIQE